MKNQVKNLPFTLVAWGITLAIVLCLSCGTWNMNFFPSDAKTLYNPAARTVAQGEHVSQIHRETDFYQSPWLHGKEYAILHFAIFQKLMRDTETLRPLVTVCILAFGFSAMLLFFVAKRYWGAPIGFICYLIFISSLWPYVYVLLVKHTLIGLCYFLLSVYAIQKSARGERWIGSVVFLAGLSWGIAIFSSTITPLYGPFLIAAWVYASFQKKSHWQKSLGALIWFFAGSLVSTISINLPDLPGNLSRYFQYVKMRQATNHFFLNQMVLRQWLPDPIPNTRGGAFWVIKYLLLIMPILFPFFLLCAGLLIYRYFFKKQSLRSQMNVGIILFLSVAAPMMAEIRGVAQYGGNYFPALIGIILLIGYFLSQEKAKWVMPVTVVLTIHVAWSAQAFFRDLYPTRMCTSQISKELRNLDQRQIYVDTANVLSLVLIDHLDSDVRNGTQFLNVDNIMEAPSGYFLVAPVIGSSIYLSTFSYYQDFDEDIFLNELVRSGQIEHYAVASIPTIAASRFWLHEEEILSFRDLVLGHFKDAYFTKGRAWILDLEKLQRNKRALVPRQEFQAAVRQGLRNIGRKDTLYQYKGGILQVHEEKTIDDFQSLIIKQGDPKDSLVLFLYKENQVYHVWVPVNNNYASIPLSGKEIAHDLKECDHVFHFPAPITLKPGKYHYVIYRTGVKDDDNYYQIFVDEAMKRRYQEKAVNAQSNEDKSEKYVFNAGQ